MTPSPRAKTVPNKLGKAPKPEPLKARASPRPSSSKVDPRKCESPRHLRLIQIPKDPREKNPKRVSLPTPGKISDSPLPKGEHLREAETALTPGTSPHDPKSILKSPPVSASVPWDPFSQSRPQQHRGQLLASQCLRRVRVLASRQPAPAPLPPAARRASTRPSPLPRPPRRGRASVPAPHARRPRDLKRRRRWLGPCGGRAGGLSPLHCNGGGSGGDRGSRGRAPPPPPATAAARPPARAPCLPPCQPPCRAPVGGGGTWGWGFCALSGDCYLVQNHLTIRRGRNCWTK